MRLLTISVLCAVLLLLTSCGNRLPLSLVDETRQRTDVTFTLSSDNAEEVTSSVNGKLNNNSTSDLECNDKYSIEKFVDGQWYQLELNESTYFTDAAIMIPPSKSNTIIAKLSTLQDTPKAGNYRLVRKYSVDDVEYYATAEFEITS